MWELVLKNIELSLILVVILLGCITANILFGLYYNIGKKGQKFNSKKLIKGLLKALTVIGGTLCLVICFTLLPQVIEIWQLDIDAAIVEAVSVVLIFGIYIYAIVNYGKDALIKLKAILEVQQDEEDNK